MSGICSDFLMGILWIHDSESGIFIRVESEVLLWRGRKTVIGLSQHEVVEAAEQLYASQLKSILEPMHDGEFVAIEPVSGEHFLGPTLSTAIQAARQVYPTRLPYVMRVGTEPAIHLGASDDCRPR